MNIVCIGSLEVIISVFASSSSYSKLGLLDGPFEGARLTLLLTVPPCISAVNLVTLLIFWLRILRYNRTDTKTIIEIRAIMATTMIMTKSLLSQILFSKR